MRDLQSLAQCAALFGDAIRPFGFDTFACGVVDLELRERHVFYVIDWPDAWLRFYRRSGLIEHDPVIDALQHRLQPFTWSELRADKKFNRAGRDALERAAAAGWSQGLVVPMSRAASRIGLVSMVGHREEVTADERAYLCLISICLQAHARTLILKNGFVIPPVGLTPREIACIRLVARGNSDSAVGRELGIAACTAHEFVEKAKRKLKTRSRVEMVAIAASLGIIDV